MHRHITGRRVIRCLLPLVSATLAVTTAASALASTVSGPDVASYQHPHGASINWSALRSAGERFVFIKATEGTAYRNPYFAGDWSGSHAAGLLHGAYDFARPSGRSGSAAAQARYFVATAGKARRAGDLPPTLDLEVNGGLGPKRLIAWTNQWVTTVRSLIGRRPMIYSYPYFWAHDMAGTRAFRGYRLWGASYGSAPTTFGGAWSTWTFWQYSSTSSIAGIHAKTDMNRFHGTLTQLRRLANMSSGSTTTSTSAATTPSTTTTSGATSTTSTTGSTSTTSGGTSSGTSRAVTTLSLRTPATAKAWQDFTVTGRLMRGTHPIAGQQVLLRGRLVGHDYWIDVAHPTTDANGRWSATVRAPASAQLQAHFAGTAKLLADYSRIKTTTIAAAQQTWGGDH